MPTWKEMPLFLVCLASKRLVLRTFLDEDNTGHRCILVRERGGGSRELSGWLEKGRA